MDPHRFDSLVQMLGAATSRRRALAALFGIVATPVLRDGAEAKPGKGKSRGKGRGKGRDQRKKQASPRRGDEVGGDAKACRGAGHPCEGNQECCNPGTTICVPSGPGAADRCTPCQAGEIACGNACTPACTASDACHLAGVCDPATGACTNPPAPEGTGCDDDDACTRRDRCDGNGNCVGRSPVVCTASDQCHDAGTCDPRTGRCSDPPTRDGAACNDGNACTRTDTCQNGRCVGDNPVVCTASDQCHLAGVCDPTSGACSNPPAPDGTGCTTEDGEAGSCDGGVCEEICTELGEACTSPGECCGPGARTCARESVALGNVCCVPTGASCSAGNPHCCGIDFGRPDGSPAFDSDVPCVDGTCCQPAGDACRTTDECCRSGEPLQCRPPAGFDCARANVNVCCQQAGAPCTSRCQCCDGFCVDGRCSATCKPVTASCTISGECCSDECCGGTCRPVGAC